MLREFDTALRTKEPIEEFLVTYTPIRKAVEDFLRGGEKIKGQNRFLFELRMLGPILLNLFNNKLEGLPLGEDKTYWKREIAIPSTHGPSVPVSVETERVLFDFVGNSDKIDRAIIKVVVGSGPKGRVAFLPPIWAFQPNAIGFRKNFESYVDIPQRLSDVLPYLR